MLWYSSAPKETKFKFGTKPPAIYSLSVPEFISYISPLQSGAELGDINNDTLLKIMDLAL